MPHRIIWSWYTDHWWAGCYISYNEAETGRGRTPPRSLLAVPNVTAIVCTDRLTWQRRPTAVKSAQLLCVGTISKRHTHGTDRRTDRRSDGVYKHVSGIPRERGPPINTVNNRADTVAANILYLLYLVAASYSGLYRDVLETRVTQQWHTSTTV